MNRYACLRFAFSDLRQRFGSSLINILATAIATYQLLVLCLLGLEIYRAQQRVMADTMPLRIIASQQSASDPDARFTPELIKKIRDLDGVAMAYPHLELNLALHQPSAGWIPVVAENFEPTDPGFAPRHMLWLELGHITGQGLPTHIASGAVVSQALWERLGRDQLTNSRQRELRIHVQRTVAGTREDFELTFPISAIRTGGAPDLVYLPTREMVELDAWCVGEQALSAPLRAKVIACSPDKVSPLASELRGLGLRTEDATAQFKGLEKLGQMLAGMIVMFVVVGLLNAGLVVLVSTYLHVRVKRREIGIMRVVGVRNNSVLRMFVYEGSILGLCAFALAAAVTLASYPMICEVLTNWSRAAWLRPDPWAALLVENAYLWSIAFVVACGFCIWGVLVPAGWAMRQTPLAMLRHVES